MGTHVHADGVRKRPQNAANGSSQTLNILSMNSLRHLLADRDCRCEITATSTPAKYFQTVSCTVWAIPGLSLHNDGRVTNRTKNCTCGISTDFYTVFVYLSMRRNQNIHHSVEELSLGHLRVLDEKCWNLGCMFTETSTRGAVAPAVPVSNKQLPGTKARRNGPPTTHDEIVSQRIQHSCALLVSIKLLLEARARGIMPDSQVRTARAHSARRRLVEDCLASSSSSSSFSSSPPDRS